MKKFFAVAAVVVFALLMYGTLRDMNKTLIVGDPYKGGGEVVTLQYVGIGDSILARYPGEFALSDDLRSIPMVVFKSEKRMYALIESEFKRKYDHVQTTLPNKRQP